MLKDNKIPPYIIVAVILVIIVIVSTIFVLKTTNVGKDVEKVTQESAKTLKEQALKAYQEKNNDKAKQLYLEANEQYVELNDTSNVVDTDAQLCILGEAEYCKPRSER